MHGVTPDRQVDLVDRLEATEMLGKAVNRENNRAVVPGRLVRERKRRDQAGVDRCSGRSLRHSVIA